VRYAFEDWCVRSVGEGVVIAGVLRTLVDEAVSVVELLQQRERDEAMWERTMNPGQADGRTCRTARGKGGWIGLAAVIGSLVAAVLPAGLASRVQAAEYRFPADADIIDVKRDFGARGDGVADDTAALKTAIQAALKGDYRNPRMVYLPAGSYLVSEPLKARVTDGPEDGSQWCNGWRSGLFLAGESRHRTVIRLKTQCPEPRGDGGPQFAGLFLTVAVSDDVIREALEWAAREFPVHPRIERIMHEQVSQQRRNRGTLRGSLFPRDNGPVGHLHRRFQPPRDVQQDPPLAGVVSDRLQQKGMRNGVEKGPDINVQHSR
jgi:hypothetical protein